MREQHRASVWPYVEIGVGFTGQGFHITTSNQGIGRRASAHCGRS